MKPLNEIDLFVDFEDDAIGRVVTEENENLTKWVSETFAIWCSSSENLSVESNENSFTVKDGKKRVGDVAFSFDERTGWYYISDIHIVDMGSRKKILSHAEWFGLFDSQWKHSISEESIGELYTFAQEHNAPNASMRNLAGVFPLYCAVYQQDIEKITALLDKGADVNFHKEKRVTTLFMAIYHENLELITLLLDAGADVNISTHFGLTPLWLAVCTENMEIIDLLLEHQADVTASAQRGLSLLNFAFKHTSDEVALKLFRSAPLDLSILDSHALSKVISNSKDSEDMLIELITAPKLENKIIYKIIESSKEPEKLLKSLIQNGLDINRQKDRYELPLLCCAVDKENFELVQLFIKYKADKSMQFELYFSYVPNDFYGDWESRGLFDPRSAMYLAKEKKNKDIINFLSEID